MAGVGYSQTGGMVLNFGLSQDNFAGSGKAVDVEFNNSDMETAYGLGFRDPYFTQDGISLGTGVHFQKRNSSSAMSNFSYDLLSANLDLGLPTNEYESLFIGFEPQHMTGTTCGNSSGDCADFLTIEGSTYDVLELSTHWSRDSRNSAIFPTEGGYQRFRAEIGVPGGVEYYKVDYRHDYFYSVTEDFTVLLKGDVGIGDGYGNHSALPFFSRYYTGGETSVRGFLGNSIGPTDSSGNAVGGNIKGVFNAEVILPIPLLEGIKSTRVSGFVDIGAVSKAAGDLSSDLRASAGISAKWFSPVGPMSFSWAKPVKTSAGDDIKSFQFTLGNMF